MSSPTGTRGLAWLIFALAAATGAAAAWHYAALDLTLSHYDSRGHLIVARRTVDSLTPGWRQIGAVWLPLPHLANLVPVQIDWAYRTGASGVAISIATLAWGLSSLGALVKRDSGSTALAIAAPFLILLNPNVLYLQSTPMTEPMLLGLSLVALSAVDRWRREPDRRRAAGAAAALAGLVLTRYEGWFIAAALISAAAWITRDRGWRVALLPALGPVAAIGAFFVLGWATTLRSRPRRACPRTRSFRATRSACATWCRSSRPPAPSPPAARWRCRRSCAPCRSARSWLPRSGRARRSGARRRWSSRPSGTFPTGARVRR
jgi:hypothetical protein